MTSDGAPTNDGMHPQAPKKARLTAEASSELSTGGGGGGGATTNDHLNAADETDMETKESEARVSPNTTQKVTPDAHSAHAENAKAARHACGSSSSRNRHEGEEQEDLFETNFVIPENVFRIEHVKGKFGYNGGMG